MNPPIKHSKKLTNSFYTSRKKNSPLIVERLRNASKKRKISLDPPEIICLLEDEEDVEDVEDLEDLEDEQVLKTNRTVIQLNSDDLNLQNTDSRSNPSFSSAKNSKSEQSTFSNDFESSINGEQTIIDLDSDNETPQTNANDNVINLGLKTATVIKPSSSLETKLIKSENKHKSHDRFHQSIFINLAKNSSEEKPLQKQAKFSRSFYYQGTGESVSATNTAVLNITSGNIEGQHFTTNIKNHNCTNSCDGQTNKSHNNFCNNCALQDTSLLVNPNQDLSKVTSERKPKVNSGGRNLIELTNKVLFEEKTNSTNNDDESIRRFCLSNKFINKNSHLAFLRSIYPTRFSDFFGNDHLVHPVYGFLPCFATGNMLPKLLIFYGEAKSGKTTLINFFLRQLSSQKFLIKSYSLVEERNVSQIRRELRQLLDLVQTLNYLKNKRIIVFLDDFQELLGISRDGFLKLIENKKFLLILCFNADPLLFISKYYLSFAFILRISSPTGAAFLEFFRKNLSKITDLKIKVKLNNIQSSVIGSPTKDGSQQCFSNDSLKLASKTCGEHLSIAILVLNTIFLNYDFFMKCNQNISTENMKTFLRKHKSYILDSCYRKDIITLDLQSALENAIFSDNKNLSIYYFYKLLDLNVQPLTIAGNLIKFAGKRFLLIPRKNRFSDNSEDQLFMELLDKKQPTELMDVSTQQSPIKHNFGLNDKVENPWGLVQSDPREYSALTASVAAYDSFENLGMDEGLLSIIHGIYIMSEVEDRTECLPNLYQKISNLELFSAENSGLLDAVENNINDIVVNNIKNRSESLIAYEKCFEEFDRYFTNL
ncbi:ATP-binding protein ASCRUDRAFT_78237 [Ascoidea rubescens DSM 1968]|uniref:ATPase AAA-type core domain-containing protein n=1 Tax=Ascoidea rubescens DSM 1968 TaxID=1344418 RepID=A0A1D2V8R3_9ASCO|nr:hypothetical protein ASCRUDRAFT_78237 [Ascoidea rubescens DSM 1968]ODV57989.1 hypothetical protein ASCRUDRAFT_78237 [Ascoidea rubescens DSM 1968]